MFAFQIIIIISRGIIKNLSLQVFLFFFVHFLQSFESLQFRRNKESLEGRSQC